MELRNYRKFRHAAVEFPDGVIGVIGPNGVGKSSLIEAISWALYGNEPQIVRTTKEEVRFSGASPTDECVVMLEFELGGDQYRLERSMRGKDLKVRATLEINGKLEAEGDTAVTQSVIGHLGMDYRSFFISVFARQKDLNALSSLRVHERKKMVLRMLDIDSLERVIHLISSDASGARKEMETFSRTLRTEDGRNRRELLETELEEIISRLEKLRHSMEKLEGEKETIDLQMAEARKVRDERSEMEERFKELRNRALRLGGRLDSLRESREGLINESEELKKMRKEIADLEDLAREYETLEGLREKMEGKIALLQERKSNLIRLERIEKELDITQRSTEEARGSLQELGSPEEGLRRVEGSLKGTERELEVLRGEIGQLESELKNEKQRKEELETRHREIDELGPESSCPTCERRLGEQYDLLLQKLSREIHGREERIGELMEEMGEKRKELAAVQKRMEVLKERQKKHQMTLLELARIRESVKGMEERLESLMKEKEEITSALSKIGELDFDQEEYEELKARIDELRPEAERRMEMLVETRRLPELENRLGEVEGELKEMEELLGKNQMELDQLPYREGDLRQAQTAYETLMESAQRKAEEIWGFRTEIQVLESETQGKRKALGELGQVEKMVAESSKRLETLTSLGGVMNDFKQNVISRIVPMLSDLSSTLFTEMTDSRYVGIELNDDYEIFIYDRGEKYPVDRFSGGESDLANLCLRLAISRVIADRSGSSVDFLILDEIFGSQDQERKRNILNTLNRLARRFRQIVLITHVDDVKDFMGNVLYVNELEDGSSLVEGS